MSCNAHVMTGAWSSTLTKYCNCGMTWMSSNLTSALTFHWIGKNLWQSVTRGGLWFEWKPTDVMTVHGVIVSSSWCMLRLSVIQLSLTVIFGCCNNDNLVVNRLARDLEEHVWHVWQVYWVRWVTYFLRMYLQTLWSCSQAHWEVNGLKKQQQSWAKQSFLLQEDHHILTA